MGIFDQLANLPSTPPVASPEPPKPAETTPNEERQPKPVNRAVKVRKTVQREPRISPVVQDGHLNKQRNITRCSFEIYQDQISVLRQVSLSAKLGGDQLSISEMVREALDSYLTAKNLNP
jgi:hypothetical protein